MNYNNYQNKEEYFMSIAEILELDQEAIIPEEYRDIILYDDYGNRVTNIATLRAIREGQEFIAMLKKFDEDHHYDDK